MIKQKYLFNLYFFAKMISKLLEIFSNYTRSLEVLYVLNDIKKIVPMRHVQHLEHTRET